ncbi:MAG: tetratricopeptide repeat protein [Burkholderiales bacterium]
MLVFAVNAPWAADTAPPPAPKADKLAAARAQIAQKNWAGALTELKQVNATGDADWNNLMGYTVRKGDTPDLAAAGKYYDEALRLNPQHRGALEYSGELFLMTNELPKAEARLASLDKACTLPCEEHTALKKAVERYKANGNKYVAAPW